MIYFDFLKDIFIKFPRVQVNFSVVNGTQDLVEPIEVTRSAAQIDPQDSTMRYAMLQTSNILRGLQPSPSTNLIVEV